MTKVYQKSDIEILIATMNRSDFSFLNAMFPDFNLDDLNLLIINQTAQNLLLTSEKENIKVINSFEKGLSKSRNLAIQNAVKELVVITDDDVVFKPNFENEIVSAFNNLNCDIINFQIEKSENQLFRKYSKSLKSKLNWFEIVNTHSVEMVLKREIVVKRQLFFDENFGLGAHFKSGEEAIFMANAKNNNLKLGYYPKPIVIHNEVTSTAKSSKKEQYYIQGAVFYAIFGKLYSFWIMLKIFFDLKQSKITFSQIIELVKKSIEGKNHYAKLHK